MKIWVDADACPGVIKDILYRAAEMIEGRGDSWLALLREGLGLTPAQAERALKRAKHAVFDGSERDVRDNETLHD